MLPRTAKFEVTNNCDKKQLQAQIRKLVVDCKDQDHICLMGLNELEVPKDLNAGLIGMSPMSKVAQDGSFDIKEYHQRVLRCIIEIFYKEKFKYVSFLPGGFESCHEFIE